MGTLLEMWNQPGQSSTGTKPEPIQESKDGQGRQQGEKEELREGPKPERGKKGSKRYEGQTHKGPVKATKTSSKVN